MKPPFFFDLTSPTDLPVFPNPVTYLTSKAREVLTALYHTDPRPPASDLTDEGAEAGGTGADAPT